MTDKLTSFPTRNHIGRDGELIADGSMRIQLNDVINTDGGEYCVMTLDFFAGNSRWHEVSETTHKSVFDSMTPKDIVMMTDRLIKRASEKIISLK